MNKQRIEIECREDGSVKIEALGFEGNACEKATAAIEKALGGKETGRAKKPEFFKRSTKTVSH
jgi:hypothetical protein